MDAYHNYRGVNGCNHGLEVFSGFQFQINKDLQVMDGKNSNHIINESIDTDSLVCGICCWEWRQAKDVMNFMDEFMNVNTIISDKFEALEKRNSVTS
jgi:hypothetical protein